MKYDHEHYLRLSIDVARRAREHGNHPFGAVLVDAEGNVVLEAENTVVTERDCTGHAETNLMRLATSRFDDAFLLKCTLYASTEPCVMCAGAIYWGSVGRVVFALAGSGLVAMISPVSQHLTLDLTCREVLMRGNRPVEVIGPLIEDEARQVHEGFWRSR